MRDLTDKLRDTQNLTDEEFALLIDGEIDTEYLFSQADKVRKEHYGNEVYIRGLIEISNYCKNDCLYCGIRKSNCCVSRYRMSVDDIFECCEIGYKRGFRTFVLQK